MESKTAERFGRKSNRAERVGRGEKSGHDERFVKNAMLRPLFRGSEMPLQDSKERSSLPCRRGKVNAFMR